MYYTIQFIWLLPWPMANVHGYDSFLCQVFEAFDCNYMDFFFSWLRLYGLLYKGRHCDFQPIFNVCISFCLSCGFFVLFFANSLIRVGNPKYISEIYVWIDFCSSINRFRFVFVTDEWRLHKTEKMSIHSSLISITIRSFYVLFTIIRFIVNFFFMFIFHFHFYFIVVHLFCLLDFIALMLLGNDNDNANNIEKSRRLEMRRKKNVFIEIFFFVSVFVCFHHLHANYLCVYELYSVILVWIKPVIDRALFSPLECSQLK